MADARLEVVEKFVEAWNGRDLEVALALVDDDFEYVNPPNALEPGTRRGTEGVTTVLTKQWEGLGDAHMKVLRVHSRDDHLITEVEVARGMPGSTARVENKVAIGWTFDGDRLVQIEVLGAGSSYNEALVQAGIESG